MQAGSAGVGRGSQFIVRLPLAVPPELAPAAAGQATAQALHRILVVDDNRDSADSLATLLQLSGHVTATAYDGPEAIDTAA